VLSQRPVDLARDRELILEFVCLANFNNDPPWFRGDSFEAYRAKWLSTPQPEGFLDKLRSALASETAQMEIWEQDGEPIGFLWLPKRACRTRPPALFTRRPASRSAGCSWRSGSTDLGLSVRASAG
jgi:hypothetical protein